MMPLISWRIVRVVFLDRKIFTFLRNPSTITPFLMQLNDEMLKLPISFLPHANWALNLKTDRLPLEFGAWISVLSDLCAFLRGYLHLPRFDSFDADGPLPFMLVPMSRPLMDLLSFHQHTMGLLTPRWC